MTNDVRQTQLNDGPELKRCQHAIRCDKHNRCLAVRLKKLCPYRCQICRRERQHA